MEAQTMDIIQWVAEIIFFGLLFLFTLHALFLAYHWFSFGTSKSIGLTALAVYLGGAAVLFLTLASTLTLL